MTQEAFRGRVGDGDHGENVSKSPKRLLVGTAGWAIPKGEQEHFVGEGSHLARYARVFPAAEINSTFHRAHQPATFERWRESVPEGFRFSAKIPKTITHELRLKGADLLLSKFLTEVAGLREKLGCLLVQLPPSLAFDVSVAPRFFTEMRSATPLPIAVEPRHASWFVPEATEFCREHELARVATDPTRIDEARRPAGDPRFAYYRLHGSPRMYYSAYSGEYLAALAAELQKQPYQTVWCLFDNTTLGAATANARELMASLHPSAAD